MFDKEKWVNFKDYSGVSIKGTVPFNLPPSSTHWDRVAWLTANVESGGKFGSVMNYDGTAMTAGLTQGIAVFPKELAEEDGNPEDDQGILWRLVSRVEQAEPPVVKKLYAELAKKGWSVSGGKLVDTNGKTVNGRLIREEFTPNQGRVPRTGPQWEQAKRWARLFHELFSDPSTFPTQVTFAIDHAKEVAMRKIPLLKDKIQDSIYGGDVNSVTWLDNSLELDLAMAVFFSHSVNAPAAAFRRLQQALDMFKSTTGHSFNRKSDTDCEVLAGRLIRILGRADFARWNASIASGRYQRTRSTAMVIWPEGFFSGPDAVMPKNP